MVTADQLINAHQKVKSGADFPAYIRDLKALGVLHYETFVSDGRTQFYGASNHQVNVPGKYAELSISAITDAEKFKLELLKHQQGKSDYPTFVKCCADTGVFKWKVDVKSMTCTYFDPSGTELLCEDIPV
ncbi:MAG: DUF1398 domain-containing protein [Flavobacteriales bacterium]|nr:DUF1398 domain-containing protein [Flavobacteriales bacterium]